MSKYVNDVRSTSSDARYMGVVFTGSMKNAIKQAKAAPDHGLSPPPPGTPKGMSRDRASLLQFLNLLPKEASTDAVIIVHSRMRRTYIAASGGYTPHRADAWVGAAPEAARFIDGMQRLGLGPFHTEPAQDAPRPKRGYSLDYAIKRGWL